MNKTTGQISPGEARTRGELKFELKYCERCGGLWLRPAGGDQTYCVGCGQAMAELPAPSKAPGKARLTRGPRWRAPEGDVESLTSDGDDAGGVA
jgi:hypothetical protein